MSSIVNKVKEVLSSDHKSSEHAGTHGTHGTHNSSVANAADPRIDSHQAGHHGTTGVHDTSLGSSDNNYTVGGSQGTHTGGSSTRTDGPHNSNLLNKADPRVDSDRDHSRNMGMNPHGTATTGGSTGFNTGSSTTGHNQTVFGSSGTANRTDGPHNSNLLNKADPRVDSDRDHSRNMGMNPHGTATTGGSTGFNTGSSTTGHNQTAFGSSGTANRTDGPHDSNLMNKIDPRVDSDRDHSRNMGMNPQGTPSTNTGGAFFNSGNTSHGIPEGSHAAHSSHMANVADPRIDSTSHGGAMHSGQPGATGLHGTSGHQGTSGLHNTSGHQGTSGLHGTSNLHNTSGNYGTHGGAAGIHSTGPAPNTAGPHSNDMLNKMDPRVDSNLDGSKTMGGDKTFNQSHGNNYAGRDPTDAAQVPPSVLQKHIGQPIVHHDDATHDREKRHSVSHQEQHRGL